jgi:hypothetical protein
MSISIFPCYTDQLSIGNGARACTFEIPGSRVCVCQFLQYQVDGVTTHEFYQMTAPVEQLERHPVKRIGVEQDTNTLKLVMVSFNSLSYCSTMLANELIVKLFLAMHDVSPTMVTPACLSEVQAHAVSHSPLSLAI